MSNSLIDSLVGYENITIYNQMLRLINFKGASNQEIQECGNKAIDTIDYWMSKVEKPFGNTFLAIDQIFLKEDTLKDLGHA